MRLLALNDFHGNLEPPTGSSGRAIDENGDTVLAGGAAYIATHLKQLRNRDTLTVAQGDLIGASPLLSAAYHDEPSVQFMGDIGVTASAVGNHEFDEGSRSCCASRTAAATRRRLLPEGAGAARSSTTSPRTC